MKHPADVSKACEAAYRAWLQEERQAGLDSILRAEAFAAGWLARKRASYGGDHTS